MNEAVPSRIVIVDRGLSQRDIEHIKSQIEKKYPGANVNITLESNG